MIYFMYWGSQMYSGYLVAGSRRVEGCFVEWDRVQFCKIKWVWRLVLQYVNVLPQLYLKMVEMLKFPCYVSPVKNYVKAESIQGTLVCLQIKHYLTKDLSNTGSAHKTKTPGSETGLYQPQPQQYQSVKFFAIVFGILIHRVTWAGATDSRLCCEDRTLTQKPESLYCQPGQNEPLPFTRRHCLHKLVSKSTAQETLYFDS